jgi:hypothetical protein
VPVLRADYFAIQAILPGVWEIIAREPSGYKAGAGINRFVVKELDMLWTIFVIILVMWLLGFSLHVGGGLIHLLLVVAVVVLVINLVSGRSTV